MERIKVPFGWHVWGWFTLLASLGVHGFLLSLPMSFSLDAPEPEPITAVPLTTLPKIASPPPELETTAVEPTSESVYAEEKTYEPTSEYSSAVEEVYEPEPEYIAADTLTYEPERQVITTPFATTVSQTSSSSFEQKPYQAPQPESEASPIFTKKYVMNRSSQEESGSGSEDDEVLETIASEKLQMALGGFRGGGDFSTVEGADTLAMLYGVDDLEILKSSFTSGQENELKPEIDPAQFRWIDDKTLEQVTAEIDANIPKDIFVINEIPKNRLADRYEGRVFEVKSQRGNFVRYINLVQLYMDQEPNAGTLFVVWNQLPELEL